MAILQHPILDRLSSFTVRLQETFSPRVRGTLSLSIPIFCTLTIFIAWISTRAMIDHARAWVDHTEDVIFSTDNLHFELLQLESTLSRHAIVRRPQDSIPYQQYQDRIVALSGRIYQQVSDNPEQQQQWQKIQTLLDTRFQYLSQLRELQPAASNLQLAQMLRKGERVMRLLRQEIEQFRTQEHSLLSSREQRLETVLAISMIAGWGLLLGSLISSLAAVYLFRGLDSAHADQHIELQRSQSMMNAIADAVVDGVITLDSNGQVSQLNRAAREMFGYDQISYPLTLDTLMDSHSLDSSLAATTDHTPESILELQGFRQDGTSFPIEVSRSQRSVHRQQLLIIRDVSERYEVQRSLEKYATELEYLNDILSFSNQTLTQRNEELDQFAYLASHDLKAPLRAITNLSTWIEDDIDSQLSSESKKLFQLLRGRAHRLEKLIDALAYYTQLGQQTLDRRCVDVGAVVSTVIKRIPEAKGFTFKFPDQLPVIQAQKTYLTEVFQNLIENAIQFHPTQSGTIQVDVEELEAAWQFSVIDDGDGIDPIYHERIFGIFQTLQARDQFESTGTGLAIVTKILKIVGGQINVISSPGQGACFQFLWPK